MRTFHILPNFLGCTLAGLCACSVGGADIDGSFHKPSSSECDLPGSSECETDEDHALLQVTTVLKRAEPQVGNMLQRLDADGSAKSTKTDRNVSAELKSNESQVGANLENAEPQVNAIFKDVTLFMMPARTFLGGIVSFRNQVILQGVELPTDRVVKGGIGCILAMILLFLIIQAFLWRKYIVVGRKRHEEKDTDECGLNEEFSVDYLMNNPHQHGVRFFHEMFERSAARFPDVDAVRIADPQRSIGEVRSKLGMLPGAPPPMMSLTYAKLNNFASRIADVLLQGWSGGQGVPYVTKPDQIVAILLPRVSYHIFASHIGAMKAGAGALLLDVNLPMSVLEYQISDAKPVAVLTLDSFLDEHARQQSMSAIELTRSLGSPAMIDVNDVFRGVLKPSGNTENQRRVLSRLRPSNLAMVIYTSGTTGKPKAVLCEHAGYVNYTLDFTNYYALVPNYDTEAQLASLSFDASLEELYGAWSTGISLVVFTDAQIRSGPELAPIICSEGITSIALVPSLLSTMSSQPEIDFPCPTLRYITVGGEAISDNMIEPWTRGRRELVNSYGPTEAAISVTRQSLRTGEQTTIGTPCANVSVFCIDHEAIESNPSGAPLRVLPHGTSGELCCSGIQLARGYWNRAELTAEKFVDNSGTRYGRAYRTGDLCCIDKQTKRIIYQGRIDTQIKINGNRIELGTVESALFHELSAIIDGVDKVQTGATHIARDAPIAAKQGNSLVGFLCVPNYFYGQDTEVEGIPIAKQVPEDLQNRCKEALAKVLPRPAVPSFFVFVPRLPRQIASGKIDRKKMPNVKDLLVGSEQEQQDQQQDIADSSAKEEHAVLQIAAAKSCFQIAREILPGFQVIDSFLSAGADSIKIALLVVRMREYVPSLTVPDLLRAQSFEQLMLEALSNDGTGGQRTKTGMPGGSNDTPYFDTRLRDCLKLHPYVFTTLQLLCIVVQIVLPFPVRILEVAFCYELYNACRDRWFLGVPSTIMVFISFCVIVLADILSTIVACLLHRFVLVRLIGRICLGFETGVKYPKWSPMHLFVWIWQRHESTLKQSHVVLDSLRSFNLRCLGARIGKNVNYVDPNFDYALAETLTIGDDCNFGRKSRVATFALYQDYLIVAPVVLERGVNVGMKGYIDIGAVVREGCYIDHLALVRSFSRGEASNEILSGVPATSEGVKVSILPLANRPTWQNFWQRPLPEWFRITKYVVTLAAEFWLAFAVMDVVDYLPFAPPNAVSTLKGHITVDQTLKSRDSSNLWAFFICILFLGSFLFRLLPLLECLLERFFCPILVGGYSMHSWTGDIVKRKIAAFYALQEAFMNCNIKAYVLRWAGCTFEPSPGCSELDICEGILPDTVVIGANSFWSGGCFVTQLEQEGRIFKVQRCRLPQNFFQGNDCITEAGSHPSNSLIGVQTVAYRHKARRQMQTRLDPPTTLFGNPPLSLSSQRHSRFDDVNDGKHVTGKEEISAYESKSGFEPTYWEFIYRGFFYDFLEPFFDVSPFCLLFTMTIFCSAYEFNPAWAEVERMAIKDVHASTFFPVTSRTLALDPIVLPFIKVLGKMILLYPLVLYLFPFGMCVFKWLTLGKLLPGVVPLFHRVPVLHFFHWDIMQNWLLIHHWIDFQCFGGTLLLGWFYSLFGAKIGKRVLLQDFRCYGDHDLMVIGDDSVVGGDSWQCHSFEDRVFSCGTVTIGDRCYVGFGVPMMGGSTLGNDCDLLHNSTPWKAMELLPGTPEQRKIYAGHPPSELEF